MLTLLVRPGLCWPGLWPRVGEILIVSCHAEASRWNLLYNFVCFQFSDGFWEYAAAAAASEGCPEYKWDASSRDWDPWREVDFYRPSGVDEAFVSRC